VRNIQELKQKSGEELVNARYERFRRMGSFLEQAKV
jgi:acetyl-CoA carboxylase alpha subunit